MCVDYRALNNKTIMLTIPCKKIKNYCYFNSPDHASGYYQNPMEKSSITKTEFVTVDRHYEYLRCPFCLCNAKVVSQRTVKPITDLPSLRDTKATTNMDIKFCKTYYIEIKTSNVIISCNLFLIRS